MNRSTIQTIGGSVLALAVGALAATLQRHPPALPASGAIAAASLSTTDPAIGNGRPIDPAFAESLRVDTGAQRWLRLLAASEEATAADLPGLIRAAGKDTAAVRMLGARWAELDPAHMFRSMHAEYLIGEDAPGALPARSALTQALFEQWSASDPQAVIKALTDVPNFSQRDSLRMTVISQLTKNNIELGLLAMNEWNVRHYLPDLKKVTEWADRDPRHAAEVALKLGSNHAGQEVLKHVGKAWAQRDPEGGLRFAATLPIQSRSALAGELIGHWAERDLAGAVKFAENQKDVPFRNELSGGLVAAWGKSDPAAALAWSNEHLRGAARSEAIGGLIKSAAEKDIAKAADLVAGMDAGPAQNRASASVFETWFNKGKDHRDAAFEWLAGIAEPEARRAAFDRVQWQWIWNDPAGAKDFLSGPHGNLASDQMIHQVARNQASKNPEAALEWAKSLGEGRSDRAKQAVLESWISIRPEGAAAYVRKLPFGPERENGVRAVSQNLIWQSPKQAAEWCLSLPSADQKLARAVFAQSGLSDDKRQELEQALSK